MPLSTEQAKRNSDTAAIEYLAQPLAKAKGYRSEPSSSEPNRFGFLNFRVETPDGHEPDSQDCRVASLENPGYANIAFSTTGGGSARVASIQYISSFDVTADLIIDPADARELDFPCSKGHLLWFRAKLTLATLEGGGPSSINEADDVDVEFISGGDVPCRGVAFEISEGRIFGLFRFCSIWDWPDYKGITPDELFEKCEEIPVDEVPMNRLLELMTEGT